MLQLAMRVAFRSREGILSGGYAIDEGTRGDLSGGGGAMIL
ncbi:hypothetical protein TIFTF001_017968 [Ficus carica]|uniref:Uncharacterized protein n=1 Tax=Ficus carica TaxID=3494 RepID=A0AA88AD70_FICCA|nr:hypothetical protein TIFTF001_017968 [Ficus carica]